MNSNWVSSLVGALLILVATTLMAKDPVDVARQQIQEMSPGQRETAQRNQERFKQLPKQEQDRLRAMHDSISKTPDGEQLRQVMLRYHEWLKTLPAGERFDLLSLPPEKRIEQIKLPF